MIVSFVLNTEYMNVQERDKWFLKNVSLARNEDVLIITHEYLRVHLDEIVENCAERFYSEFEMDKISADEIRKMNIVYVPDHLVSALSRTQEILDLNNKRNKEFEEIVIHAIDGELKRRKLSSPDYILNSLHVFESVRYISEYYNCPIVPYVFSAIRKVHGYNQTLYMAHIGKSLFNSDEAKKLYCNFDSEKIKFELFSNKELLALLGKKHNLCLLPMVDIEGKYELAVIGEGFHITPQTYQEDLVTDDDIYFEAKKLYDSSEIKSRLHPIQMDQAGVGRKHMKNDPAGFLLSCKRATTVQSQMIVKATLWNRAVCSLSNSLPYAFLFEHKLDGTNKLSKKELNFILLCYFVPNNLMFNKKYWLWRKTNPSANEIFNKHLNSILVDLKVKKEWLFCENRLQKLLELRGCSKKEIERFLLPFKGKLSDLNYSYLSSKATIFSKKGKLKDIFCLNSFNNEDIYSEFVIEEKEAEKVDLYLTNDIDGFVTINEIRINGNSIPVNSNECYIQKNMIVCSLDIAEENRDTTVEVVWSVKGYDEAF